MLCVEKVRTFTSASAVQRFWFYSFCGGDELLTIDLTRCDVTVLCVLQAVQSLEISVCIWIHQLQEVGSFKAFELQSSMASRPCDAETFTCQSSDGCTEPTSQPNVLAQQGSSLCATSWASGEETIWREPMIQETSSDMSQIRESKVTVNHKSTF